MCGITGWISFGEAPGHRPDVIERMTAALAPRGPDGAGVWRGPHAAIGHRRLAVLDVDGGAQPMTAGAGDAPPAAGRPAAPDAIVLSYSGEVYNHHQLRVELRALGREFATRSDTEVVLRGYQEWGAGLAGHLEGMYAFAVWDARARRLLLVRDRMGVKPLYYARTPDGGLVFGSEPKALFAHPDRAPRVDAQGLEVRVPYCDHRLVEYAFNTPWELQTHDGREKSLLRAVGAGLAPPSVLWRAENHYPATHHPDYNRGLQKLAREALDAAGGRVRDLVDERVVGSCLTTEPERLEWGHRLRLERVVDLALWLDHYRPEIAV
ncbi:asparagine synthetase, glutamine-hydrolysing [Streptomyces noursei ATCC 11455]|uniref:asparagine synthase-related protein n=1 Tax=Streptomyces noursei TaxID=1971 RepID=UPI00081CFF5D|nr:asparagine synthetase, glutamine-hydrolysing [Streptomyces noursei ATCC 11455]